MKTLLAIIALCATAHGADTDGVKKLNANDKFTAFGVPSYTYRVDVSTKVETGNPDLLFISYGVKPDSSGKYCFDDVFPNVFYISNYGKQNPEFKRAKLICFKIEHD